MYDRLVGRSVGWSVLGRLVGPFFIHIFLMYDRMIGKSVSRSVSEAGVDHVCQHSFPVWLSSDFVFVYIRTRLQWHELSSVMVKGRNRIID